MFPALEVQNTQQAPAFWMSEPFLHHPWKRGVLQAKQAQFGELLVNLLPVNTNSWLLIWIFEVGIEEEGTIKKSHLNKHISSLFSRYIFNQAPLLSSILSAYFLPGVCSVCPNSSSEAMGGTETWCHP